MCWSSHRSWWEARGHDAMPAPPPDLRVSDRERQEVIAQLSKHTGEGRLTLDEFEARVDEVWNASKQAELRHALRELPAPPQPQPARNRSTRGRHHDAEPLVRFVVFVA